MRIYLAAPWAHRGDMSTISQQLEAEGHTITWKWWETEDIPESNKTAESLMVQANHDAKGVMDANLLLVINSAKSEGKAVEQGIAITQNKPIIIVGKRGEHSINVFHYLPLYRWVDDVQGALNVLSVISWLIKNGGDDAG